MIASAEIQKCFVEPVSCGNLCGPDCNNYASILVSINDSSESTDTHENLIFA